MRHLRSLSQSEVLKSIKDSIPNELFKISGRKSAATLTTTVLLLVAGFFLLVQAPWYFVPIAWIFVGTVYAGLNAVSYDCSLGLFSRHDIVNSIVGTLVSLPLLFPFESFKAQIQSKEYAQMSSSLVSGPFWWIASAAQWARANFDLHSAFKANKRRILASVSLLYIFVALFFPLMVRFVGVWGLIKYWLAPWIVYHFWMSTFITTSYRQTGGVHSKQEKVIVVHVNYPKWVEFLSNNINYIITTDQISKMVPNYNVKKAYLDFKKQLGANVEEMSFYRAMFETMKSTGFWWFSTLKQIKWPTAIFLVSTPPLAIYGATTTPLQANTAYLSLFMFIFAGLGITVGYHRYFAHRAFDAVKPIRYLLLLMGTTAFQGSAIWWCRDHRAHHRFSDTPKDPYGVDRGFFWAHMGWLFVKQDESKIGKTDMSDLLADPILMFQWKYFHALALFTSFFIPTMIAGLGWGDYWGGFYYACVARIVLVNQSTFCINSVAHYFGESTYSDDRSSKDALWVSFLTFGEGYHNFHHEFPYDYRNGVRWYNFDPSKWLIWAFSLFGLTYDLKRFPTNEIEKGVIQMKQKKLDLEKSKIKWAEEATKLPYFNWQQIKERVLEGSSLIVIDGFVLDVTDFAKIHPGGEKLITAFLGKDATGVFNGGIYKHANGARNLASMLRIGRLAH